MSFFVLELLVAAVTHLVNPNLSPLSLTSEREDLPHQLRPQHKHGILSPLLSLHAATDTSAFHRLSSHAASPATAQYNPDEVSRLLKSVLFTRITSISETNFGNTQNHAYEPRTTVTLRVGGRARTLLSRRGTSPRLPQTLHPHHRRISQRLWRCCHCLRRILDRWFLHGSQAHGLPAPSETSIQRYVVQIES